MKYIEDFREGESIVGHYYCKKREQLKSKSGKNYLSLILSDKTGTVDAKVWELNNSIGSFETGDFVKIDGVVTVFNEQNQLKITRLRKSQEGEYLPEDYVPSTDKDIDSIIEQLFALIKSINSPHIRKMLEIIFDKSGDILPVFKVHSAAKSMHHSYMGGLAEHTLSVVQLCDFMSGRYKHVNRDVLIAAAMLHDVGKIYELSGFPENDYTDEGQLLGHIIIGERLASEVMNSIDGFPRDLKNLISHCILSHHGEYEYGSPKLPMVIEAFILHCCDNMDAKTKMFEEALSKDKTNGAWIGFNRMLARNIRKTDVSTD